MKYVPKEEIDTRIAKLKILMERASLDGAFFHYKVDYYYLSGTMQDCLLFVPVDGEPLLFVKREMSRARRESPLKNLVSYRSIKDIPQHVKPMKRIGMQLDVIPYNDAVRFKELFGDAGFVDCSPLTKEIRKKKSPFEIAMMEKGAEIGRKVYAKVPEFLHEGATEIEVGGKMEAYAKSLGHEGLLRVRSLNYEAYTWHVLSGRTGSIVSQSDSPMGGLGLSPAFPVGASLKKIRKNEPILIDFGICYHGYQVDQTRMYAIGSMPDEFVKGYWVCKEIHDRVLEKVVAGYTSKELFEYSKELAEKAGYADWYLGFKPHKVRFLGHGIGIELAEFPYIAATHTYPIEDGEVFAIEPKMVWPRKGCCGYENTIHYTHGKCRVITDTDDNIIIA